MLLSLGTVFNVSITKTAAREIAKTFMMGKIGQYAAISLLKIIPGLGSVVNAAVAASLTEALGWDSARDFEERKKGKE
jgi:uncharacterized protein (DUF697 family)